MAVFALTLAAQKQIELAALGGADMLSAGSSRSHSITSEYATLPERVEPSGAKPMQRVSSRLLVNAVYWAVGLDDKITDKADVALVGDYKPEFYGFIKDYKGKVKPADLLK